MPLENNRVARSRRRPRACDGCYQRKIRCDDSTESCRNCQIYGVPCITTRADGSMTRRGQSLFSENRAIPAPKPPSRNHRRDREGYDSIQQRKPRNSLTYAPSQYVDALNEVSDHHSRRTPYNPQTASSTSDLDNVLEGALTIENARVPLKCKYAGRNAVQTLAKSAEDMFQVPGVQVNVMRFFCPFMNYSEDIPEPPCVWQPLCDISLAERYVDAFFANINSLFPVLLESQFRQSFHDFYEEGQSGDVATVCCIYLVIALGSRSAQIRDDQSIHFETTWSLYSRIMASPYLPSAQALLLMTLELMSRNKIGQAILSVGSAIRIAQSLGLHRALSSHKHPQERTFVSTSYQLRKCVWWVCYCLDKKLSFESGRPSIINDFDCDAETAFTQDELQDPGPLGTEPANRSPFFLHFVALCQILSEITRRLFIKQLEPRDETEYIQHVEALDTMLVQWKTELPRELQLDPEIVGTETRVSTGRSLLHCMYYDAMLTCHLVALLGAHSPEVKNHPNGRLASAEVLCGNAARALAGILHDLASKQHNWPVIGWTTKYIIHVVFALYVGIMRNPDSWICESDTALMKSMTLCFTQNTSNKASATAFGDLVTSLCCAVEVTRKARHGVNSHLTATASSDVSARRNSPTFQQSAVGSPFPLSSSQAEMITTGLHFEDLFGFSGDNDQGNYMQLWPVDIDEFERNNYMGFGGGSYE